jgi:hypothetical protein
VTTILGPHVFQPMPSPLKQRVCVKCGRPKSDALHRGEPLEPLSGPRWWKESHPERAA